MTNKTLALAILLIISLSGCEGIFSGIYDSEDAISQASTLSFGFNKSDKYTGQIYLDCTNYQEWVYLDLDEKVVTSYPIPDTLTSDWDGKSGRTFHHVEFNPDRFTPQDFMKTDPQQEPQSWHIAIHHFDVRTNGAGVYETLYTSLSQLPASGNDFANAAFVYDEPSDNQAIVDRTKMLSYYIGYQTITLNRILTGWATMDFSTPPPIFASTGHVYIVKFPSGKYCAIHLDDYRNSHGEKGFMTISYIYPY